MSHTGTWGPKVLHLASDKAAVNPDPTKNGTATFNLSRPIYVPADYGLYISCISAVVPYSFWSVPTALTIPITYGAGNTPRNLTVPAGNYSAPAIGTNYLSDATSGLTVAYNASTGVFVFQTNGTNQITFPAQAANLNIGIPASGLTIATSSSYTAPLAPLILGTKSISVNTDIPLDTCTAGVGNAQTLCFIPVDAQPNQYIVYKPGQGIPIKQVCRTNYISSITVSLQDESGNNLDFKGVPWAIDLCFELLTPPDVAGVSFTEQVEGGSLFDASRRTPAQTKAYCAL